MKRINNETTPRVIASAFSHLYVIPEGEDDAVTHILGLSDSNRKKNYVAFQCDLFYRVGRKVIDDLLSEEAPAPAPSPALVPVAEPVPASLDAVVAQSVPVPSPPESAFVFDNQYATDRLSTRLNSSHS